MKQNLQNIQHVLRHTRLLNGVEYIRFLLSVARLRSANNAFIKQHPRFALPPAALAYDAYSAPDWNYYFKSGLQTAEDIGGVIQRGRGKDPRPLRVLEWGCGPGRIIRHLPGMLGGEAEIHGCDYNAETIGWCKKHIAGVQFLKNDLTPILPYASSSFDVVYAISVFTHLSEESCTAWMMEISRILKDSGLLLFTTHSDTDAQFLLPHEKVEYERRGVWVRGLVKEGRKMYGAWHHPDYVRNTMLAGYEIIEHAVPGTFPYIQMQDTWIARKGLPRASPPAAAAR